MKLEGVLCSVDYGDFLAETLPVNRALFDKLVVVTTPEDIETQRVCRYWNVPHVQTDVFRTRWGEMHKSKGINKGLEQLDMDGWVLHLDADIVLPPRMRDMIKRADLDPSMLYGADRFMVKSYEDWQKHKALPAMQHDNYHVNLDMFQLAPRFSGERMGGYAPPGYFQLWNPRFSNVRRYPEEHTDASRTDVLFSSLWWRNKRQLLAEFAVYHLESEQAQPGANWEGRVTKRWGPWPDLFDHHHPRWRRRHEPPHLWNGRHHNPQHGGEHHPYGPGPEHHRHHHHWPPPFDPPLPWPDDPPEWWAWEAWPPPFEPLPVWPDEPPEWFIFIEIDG